MNREVSAIERFVGTALALLLLAALTVIVVLGVIWVGTQIIRAT